MVIARVYPYHRLTRKYRLPDAGEHQWWRFESRTGVRMSNGSRTQDHVASAGFPLAIICFAYFIPTYAQFQVSPYGTTVMETLGISSSQFALLMTSPMIPAILLSLVAGVLIDRFGPKQVIGLGLAVTTLGCAIRIFSNGYLLLLFGTALSGITACFLTSGASKIIAGFYGADRVRSKMGIFMASVSLSMTISLATSAYFGELERAFIASTVLSVIGLVLWLVFMKNPASDHDTTDERRGPRVIECLRVALRSRNTWMAAFALAFTFGANMVVSTFTPTALSTRGFDANLSGIVTSLYTLGSLAGCFVSPQIVRLLDGRQKPVLVGLALLGSIGVALAWRPENIALLCVAMFITGCCLGGCTPLAFSLPVQFKEIGTEYAGTAGGILSTIQVTGAVTIPSYVIAPIAGDNFSLLFLLGGVSLAIAAFFYALIKIR